MKKSTVFLISCLSLLGGVIIGFFLAPVKAGFGGFGNNSGNNFHFHYPNSDEADKTES